MKLLKNLFAASAVALALAAAAPASAALYDGLVIFGDSLSDSGNNYLAATSPPHGSPANITPASVITNTFVPSFTYAPAPPYPFGVYSNGPVWATPFAAALGLSALPSLAGGGNFAFGGATTGADSPTPSLTDQMGMFLNGTGGVAPGNYLYVVAGGGNNARHGLEAISANPGDFANIITNTSNAFAADVGNIVDTLHTAGAQHIVVWNAPNLGTAPAVLAQGGLAPTFATGMAQSMNLTLDARLSGEAGVKVFDIFGALAGVIADPKAYGMKNVTDACVQGTCDVATNLFWDGIHPTEAGHQLIANAMIAAVVPEPQTYVLFAIGLAGLTLLARRRRAHQS